MFTFNMQATDFVCGGLALVWAPLMSKEDASTVYAGNLVNCFTTRHMLMFPGVNSTVDFEIPFMHYKRSLDTRKLKMENLGTLLVVVVSPLNVGPDSPVNEIGMTTYARFVDNQFSVVNPKANPDVEAQGGTNSKASYNIWNVTESAVDFDSSTVDRLGGVTATADVKVPLDKPNVAINPPPVQTREFPNICNSVAITYAPRLDLDARPSGVATSADLAVETDEMLLRTGLTRFTPIANFNLTVTQPPNTILYTGDLVPGHEFFTEAENATFQPCLLTYMSAPFTNWRGSLRYKIIAFASRMHAAKLVICSHIGFEAAGLTINEAMGQFTTVVEINGTTSVEILFPWQSRDEWKQVCNGAYSDATDLSMGQFSIRVLSPLQYMASLAPSIHVMVLVAAGDDFELMGLENSAMDFRVVSSEA